MENFFSSFPFICVMNAKKKLVAETRVNWGARDFPRLPSRLCLSEENYKKIVNLINQIKEQIMPSLSARLIENSQRIRDYWISFFPVSPSHSLNSNSIIALIRLSARVEKRSSRKLKFLSLLDDGMFRYKAENRTDNSILSKLIEIPAGAQETPQIDWELGKEGRRREWRLHISLQMRSACWSVRKSSQMKPD